LKDKKPQLLYHTVDTGDLSIEDEFNIYTREAGAGGLSIAVEGPSKAEVDFEDRKDGSCGVTYSVTEPGRILLLFMAISCYSVISDIEQLLFDCFTSYDAEFLVAF